MDRRRNYIELIHAICDVCKLPIYQGADKQAHHGTHDTIANNGKWPYYTNSIMCRRLKHTACHAADPGGNRVPDATAEAWENLLSAWADLVKQGAETNISTVMKELEIIRDEIRSRG